MTQTNDIMNMKQVVQRAADNNIPLSEYTLRRAVRSGQLPCRIVGRTYLISWDNVMRWLRCEDMEDSTPADDATAAI